jgi:inner membrane protein involved in colicin E2 resistance
LAPGIGEYILESMSGRIKNFILNELFYLFLAPTLILLVIVVYGILFDVWYDNAYSILMASGVLYLVLLFLRLTTWLAKKVRR